MLLRHPIVLRWRSILHVSSAFHMLKIFRRNASRQAVVLIMVSVSTLLGWAVLLLLIEIFLLYFFRDLLVDRRMTTILETYLRVIVWRHKRERIRYIRGLQTQCRLVTYRPWRVISRHLCRIADDLTIWRLVFYQHRFPMIADMLLLMIDHNSRFLSIHFLLSRESWLRLMTSAWLLNSDFEVFFGTSQVLSRWRWSLASWHLVRRLNRKRSVHNALVSMVPINIWWWLDEDLVIQSWRWTLTVIQLLSMCRCTASVCILGSS